MRGSLVRQLDAAVVDLHWIDWALALIVAVWFGHSRVGGHRCFRALIGRGLCVARRYTAEARAVPIAAPSAWPSSPHELAAACIVVRSRTIRAERSPGTASRAVRTA